MAFQLQPDGTLYDPATGQSQPNYQYGIGLPGQPTNQAGSWNTGGPPLASSPLASPQQNQSPYVQQLIAAGIPAAQAQRFAELQTLIKQERAKVDAIPSGSTVDKYGDTEFYEPGERPASKELEALQNEADQMRRSPEFVNVLGAPSHASVFGIPTNTLKAMPFALGAGMGALMAAPAVAGVGATEAIPAGATAGSTALSGSAPYIGAGGSAPAGATGAFLGETALPALATAGAAAGLPSAATAGGDAVAEWEALETGANLAPTTTLKTMPGLTDWVKLGYSIYNTNEQNQRAKDLQEQLRAGFERSDPFAPGRAVALQQYMDMANKPESYMSSPLARLQIDELNRAVRAKQAGLGQTWNIDETGNIRGSGTGAVDFATQLQANFAKQYETALSNRAQQAGMTLFPNAQMLQSQQGAAGMQNQAGNQQAGNIGIGIDFLNRTGVFDSAKNWGKDLFGIGA